MTERKLLSFVRKTVSDFNMIQPGDNIAVAFSGGKDSMAALCALSAMRRFYPVSYSLCAMYVSLGFEGEDASPIARFCETINVPFYCVKTNIGHVVFNERKEKNPCSLCSKMRKGALYGEAKKIGVNKVALGHNKDDLIQTFFLSLFYEGRVNAFSPAAYLDRTGICVIRPLIYVSEANITGFIQKNNYAPVKNLCPVNGKTKREQIKNFIKAQNAEHPHFSEKVFTAVKNKIF